MLTQQKYTFLFLLLLFKGITLVGQSNYLLILSNQEDSILYQENFSDSLSLYQFVDSLQRNDLSNGYLLSSVDTIERVDSTFLMDYYKGDVYRFGIIEFDKSLEWVQGYLPDELKKLENQKLNFTTIAKIADRIVTDQENKGYPFCTVKLDSVRIEEESLNALLTIDRGTYITMDTIQNIGFAKVSSNFLFRYLDIKTGAPFDRRKILNLDKKLKELSFVRLKEVLQLSFVNNQASIVLNLEKNKSNHFDFIIGLLQNTTAAGQEYSIVADFTAEMLNQLGYGERFFLQFQRLRPENQSIKLAFDYPFLLDTPFGVNFSFEQFRNEDQWIDRSFGLGVQYYQQGRDNYNLSWINKTSSLIAIDTTTLFQQKKLPANLDIAYNGLGIGLYKEKLNYRFNPSKGYELELSTQLGYKKITPNVNIQSVNNDEVDFSMAYDTVALNTYQVGATLKASYFQPILKNITIKTSVNSAYQYNEKQLFQNELFRIGGNKLLRGFDEQSILSSFYTVLSAELRFILAQQDNNFTLSLPFIDYGFEYNPLRDPSLDKWDRPIGVGVGMNFQTGVGIFSFAMAVGKRLGNPFDFSNLKIHFGYVNLF